MRASFAIARTETRRSVRVTAGNRTKLLLTLGIVALALGPLLAVGMLLLPTAGELLADGDLGPFDATAVTGFATGGVALAWIFLALLATLRTVTTVADIDRPECLLVSTSLRNVVLGVVGAELLRFGLWLFPLLFVLSAAFAYGFGSPLPVILVLTVTGVLLLTAIPVGFVVGVWIRHVLVTFEPIARYRSLLFVGVGVAYFAAIATGWFDAIIDWLFHLLADSPLGWPGHILLASVPGASPSTGALVGVGLGAGLLLVTAIKAGTISAGIHWHADPARTETSVVEAKQSTRLSGVLSYGFERQTRAVSLTAIRRTKRAPVRLLYVAYPLLGLIFIVDEIIQAGQIPAYVAVLLCAYVVWGSGALFTLNPLGDAGRALPAVLTSTITGRQMTVGLAGAGALFGVPIAILTLLLVAIASPLSVQAVVLLGVGTVAGAVVTPVLATGIGTLFPRFGSVRVTGKREAVMPSKTAFVVYTLTIGLPLGAAALLYTDSQATLASLLSLLVSLLPAIDATIPTVTITVVAWGILLFGLVAPFVSYRYAVRAFDDCTVT